MAQAGIHGIVGLSVGRHLPQRRCLTLGFVLGNILPDVDMLALAVAYPFDRHLAFKMHRTFTHSLCCILITVAVFYFLSLRKGPPYRYLGYGLGMGIGMHIALDFLLWFDGVDVLWPLSALGGPGEIDLWRWYQPPELVFKLLRAAEFLFASLYFLSLSIRAEASSTDLDFLERLRHLRWLQLVFFTAFVGLALSLRQDQFLFPFGLIYVFVMLPLVIYVTIRLRETVEAA